jgi:energy-coupling factor transporter ATP-binding protein EcfA2
MGTSNNKNNNNNNNNEEEGDRSSPPDEAGGWTVVVPANKNAHQRRRRHEGGVSSSAPSCLSWIDELPIIPPPVTADDDGDAQPPAFPLSMLLLVGLPGSGKSTLARALCRCLPWKYVRINQDELAAKPRSKGACQEAVRAALFEQQKCPIVDRCNLSRAQRQAFLQLTTKTTKKDATSNNDHPADTTTTSDTTTASDTATSDTTTTTSAIATIPTDCIVFEIPMETCIYRCQQRRQHPTVAPSRARQIVNWQQREYEPLQQLSSSSSSSSHEGFRSVTFIRDDESFHRVIVDLLMRKE